MASGQDMGILGHVMGHIQTRQAEFLLINFLFVDSLQDHLF